MSPDKLSNFDLYKEKRFGKTKTNIEQGLKTVNNFLKINGNMRIAPV